MKKLIPFIALIPLVVLALTPPWSFQLDCTINSLFWLWMVFLSGFLTFAFWYQKVSVWLKLLVIWCFVSCFLSRAPYISFTMFWSVIACAYYYSLCRKIEDFTIVHKAVQSIFFFVCLLVAMQLIGKDTLLNFKHPSAVVNGIIGNKMIASTFIGTLAPLLIINPLNWVPLVLIGSILTSSGYFLALCMGVGVLIWNKGNVARWGIVAIIIALLSYTWLTGDIKTFEGKAGRGKVWKKTIELSVKHPQGFGISTYRILFPYMCGAEIRDQQPGREWNTAHNLFLQGLFEIGFIGMILMIGWLISIVLNVIKYKNYIKLSGLAILFGLSMVHFPDRTANCVLVMIMFLAWCSSNERQYVLVD